MSKRDYVKPTLHDMSKVQSSHRAMCGSGGKDRGSCINGNFPGDRCSSGASN
ncbi:MAG: hypothetical protein KDK90_11400 [Leptospiraceae bacterium]|nr:hypothetical protein [Leptospiraceae bacterium]